MKPLFDLVLRHVKPPHGRGRAVPAARHHPGGQSLSRPHRHRPHQLGLGQAEPGRQGARLRRQAGRDRPRHQGAGVPRPGARSGRRGRGRRHRRARRAAGSHRRPHHLRSRGRDADPRPADRSADAGHDVPRQRFAARRHRRHQGHRPHDPRPAAARGRRQRGAARPRIRRQGFDGGRRPRRIAARHPDRDHAARGLRAVGVAAEGAAPPQRGGRTGRADRRGRDRRRRDPFRRRRAEDVGAQGRDDRDASRPAAIACGWCSTRRRAA